MKRMLIIIIACVAISCSRGIHETIYQVDFIDGTTTSVVGYSVTTINSHYVVKSVYNNSIFEIKQVKGIYPKEIGVIWNPAKKE